MIVVLQRVKKASVTVEGRPVGEIGGGLCLLVGVEKGDGEEQVLFTAGKAAELRIFPDEEGRMNRSVLDTGGAVLAVSQFTLAGSVNKGRRPGFDKAEEPERARELFNRFVHRLEDRGLDVKTGVFGALMEVSIINDGPVTFIIQKNPETS
jgi:D-tyrosyl-tRNA(Tyr) deacylase